MSSETMLKQLSLELKEVNMSAIRLTAVKSLSNNKESFIPVVEQVSEVLEKAVITSRNTLERLRCGMEIPKPGAPVPPYVNISGTIRVIEHNWLHIMLNALLPHCRFQTPLYLSDTITRLLDNYTACGGKIPYHENAMLIIDEHCDIENRRVYDTDNKGWKAVPNALKGRVFPDDDQFRLGVALVSTCSHNMSCNIFIINSSDAGEFFNIRSGGSLYW